MLSIDHVAYGKRDEKLLYIADVQRGLACGCVCTSCARPLIAKKGAKRRHHFAHYGITDCRGAPESILHLLSKELLSELDLLAIPPYDYHIQRRTKAGSLIQHHATVVKGGLVRIDGVQVEAYEDGFVPDIIVRSRSKSLIVEVAVSNKVKRPKLRRMRQRNLPAIEIRLDPSDSLRSRDWLRAKLQTDLASKAWLFHPAQRDAEKEFLSKWRDVLRRERRDRSSPKLSQRANPQDSIKPISALHSQLGRSRNEYDRTAEDFYKRHGRYPTMEECLKLWPRLYSKHEL